MLRIAALIFLFCVNTTAQIPVHKYFIRFTDKNGSAFSISRPEEFLSTRSIERRKKQHIPVTSQDLPVNVNYIDSVLSKGAVLYTRSKWFNGITVSCDSIVLNQILSLPFVQAGEKVFRLSQQRFRKDRFFDSSFPSGNELSVTDNSYGGSYSQIHLMHGDFLHETGNRGEGMVLAMIDDGFGKVDQFSAFENLRNRSGILATWDFVENEEDVYDDGFHGTAVLSTIAGYLSGQLIGTAPNASFLLLRTEDTSTENIIEEYNWNAAAEFADSAGADIISTSLGYTEFDNTADSHSYSDMDGDHCPSSIAADIAVSKGMLVVASAGNSGSSPWHYIGAPSDGDSVICVGAVDSTGEQAGFSSYGPAFDGSIKPNVVAQGVRCVLVNSLGNISQGNGTSFSCPILAGSAACLWQHYSEAGPMEIKKAIEKSSSLYSVPNESMGYGLPDFRVAGYFLSKEVKQDLVADEILGVFPNPFSNFFRIRFFSTSLQSIRVDVFNSLGQNILTNQYEVQSNVVNVIEANFPSSISEGVYFLRIVGHDGSYDYKLLNSK